VRERRPLVAAFDTSSAGRARPLGAGRAGWLTLRVAFGGVSPQKIAANLAVSLRTRVSEP
jgi:hypothetical protein